jgi:hypothetical protein
MIPRRPRRRSLVQLAGATTLAALLPERVASAEHLTQDDLARLAAGEIVRVPLDLDLPQGDYFGGVAYAVIPATVGPVTAVLDDPATYRSILPMTLDARVLSQRGGNRQVYLRQGGRLGSTAYVLLVRRESQGLFRFWLDPTEPHEIADCWGYFRVSPWGRAASLLTYAALVRLESGVVRLLFKEAIRGNALGTPALVRAYVTGGGMNGGS